MIFNRLAKFGDQNFRQLKTYLEIIIRNCKTQKIRPYMNSMRVSGTKDESYKVISQKMGVITALGE